MAGRENRYNYLIQAGFLKAEARELSHTSKAGMKAPYFRAFINSRRSLKLNAIRYGWAVDKYRQAVKQLYVDKGAIKRDAWGRVYADPFKLLRWYEDRSPIPKDEYTSPWRKKIEIKSGTKRKINTVTRRAMLVQWIKEVNENIAKTTSEFRRKQLTEQRDRMQKRLDSMG